MMKLNMLSRVSRSSIISRNAVTVLDKVLYTAKTTTTGGRDGTSRSDDGRLDIKHSPPGAPAPGTTNPEQLFAAGYSACFIGAMKAVAGKQNLKIPDPVVDASVDLGTSALGYGVAVRMTIKLPGMDRVEAQKLIDAAHAVCPYSNATRGNIPVDLTLA
jgi:Ohr subfamily peroxiredoxin